MALHFVGFKDGRYWKAEPAYARAVEIFGEPDFFHRTWDARAVPDIAPGDRVVWKNNVDGWIGRSLPPYFHYTFPADHKTFDDSREDIVAHGGEKGVDYI